jgi:hypothetical protein
MGSVEDFDQNSLVRAVEETMACQDRREQMARLGRTLVDGEGISRVLDSILSTGVHSPALSMRAVEPDEHEDFLKMEEQHFREPRPISTASRRLANLLLASTFGTSR